MTKNVFFGAMLGILILQKYIQKELGKVIKSLLMTLIMIELNFLLIKMLAKLKKRTTFALMSIVMKTSWFYQYTFQIKNLKT